MPEPAAPETAPPAPAKPDAATSPDAALRLLPQPCCAGRSPHWWAEKQFWVVAAVLAAALLTRLDAVPFRGEEHRRAQVTAEMAAAGDWVVPRQQGQVYLSRPPLQQWLLAASAAVFGDRERWVARLPSALAVLLASLLVYAYARQFIGTAGATVAALAYATNGQMLGDAQQAETEPVFAALLGSALVLWHWGYARGWPPYRAWALGYVFTVLAGLCKGGLQPPVYFFGPVGLFLLWKRDVRYAFTRGHLIGLAAGAAVLAAWAVPCAAAVGWETTRRIWMTNTEARMVGWQFGEVTEHLLKFPAEVFGCLLPWGLLLPAALVPAVRRSMAGCAAVPFCLCVLLVAFPSCWIPPGGQTRYLVPIYPCIAVLIGVVADRAVAVAAAGLAWRRYMVLSAAILAGAGVAFFAASFYLPGTKWGWLVVSPERAAAYAVVLTALAVAAVRLRRSLTPAGVSAGAVAVALGCAVVTTGVLTDALAAHTNDIGAALAPVRDRIPADAEVVSTGYVHAGVRYYLERTVPVTDHVRPGVYFCAEVPAGVKPKLPFQWEEVATVSVDRYRTRKPETDVVIGRRLPRQKQ